MGLFSFFKKTKSNNGGLHPESNWKVEISKISMSSIDYELKEKTIELNKISQIVIETNDSGPWGTDLWWKISGGNILLTVPEGATGEPEMLEVFQSFSKFNNEEFIKAMSSTDNAEFVVWKKQYCLKVYR